jgi:hypothetical protein
MKPLIIKLNDMSITSINGVTLVTSNLAHTDANVKLRYQEYLIGKPSTKKIPYIFTKSMDVNVDGNFYDERPVVVEPFNMSVLRDINIWQNTKTKENLLVNYQKGADIRKYGRRKGNMQYLEDSWNVQIQSLNLPFAYIKNGVLAMTSEQEMKNRDNYIKLRVKYTGTEYAIINALRTLMTISYA